MLDDALRTVGVLAQLGGRVEALTAGIARVACIDLVGLFLAGENHLVGIDDDDVVTTIDVRGECGFVLSAQQLGNLRAQATNNLVGSVDDHPLFVHCGCFLRHGNSLVA